VAKPQTPDGSVNVLYDDRPRQLSRWRRMQVPVIGGAVYAFLRILGPTLRFETIGLHNLEDLPLRGERAIAAFWHRCIFSAVWRFRGRGAVVMNTPNFDGQWTRVVIERLGYGTAQGSSSRGGLRGLLEMEKRLAQGHEVAFTIDGPRGPRYVAKPGPVMLARRTGQPIVVFHSALERAITFKKSWDLLQIPMPFTRAIMVVAPPIHVPAGADAKVMEDKQAEMQTALERVRDVAEGWFQLGDEERSRLRAEFNAE
jgi:lysophospholipid acyltransferase (LPLAT)-like uncharacterized protein